MVSKKKKGRKKNIYSKNDQEEKSTRDQLFLKKIYSKWIKFFKMFRGAVLKTKRSIMCFCIFIPNDTGGMDEMQEILVISQTELQDFTNLECLTTLRLRSGESPEESYEDTESVVHGSENCSDTRTHVTSDQFAPTRENNCEGMQGNSNTHGDIILTSRSSISSSGNDQENSPCRIDQNLKGSSGESPEESYEDTESVVNGSENCSDTRTQEQIGPTCESNSEAVQGNSNTHSESSQMVCERSSTSISSSISSSGNDQENCLGRSDQNLMDSSVYIPSLSEESPEESHGDTERLVDRSDNFSDTRTQELFGLTCNCKGVQLNSMTLDELLKMVNEIYLTHRLPSTSLSGNDQENSLDKTDSFFSVYIHEGVQWNSNAHGESLIKMIYENISKCKFSPGNGPKNSLGSIDALLNDSSIISIEIDEMKTEVQASTKAESLTALGNRSSSRRQEAELCEKSEKRISYMKDQQQEIEKVFQISDTNDQFQQFSTKFPLSIDTSFSRRQETQLHEQMISYLIDQLRQVLAKSRPSNDTSSSRRQVAELCKKSEKMISYMKDQQQEIEKVISDTNDQFQQFSTKFPLSIDTSFSRRQETQLHEQMISYLIDQLRQVLAKSRPSNDTSSSRRQVAELCKKSEKMKSYLIDQLPQISAKLLLSNDTRFFSVVNWKVYFLEQADASDILKLDSNVVVGLSKSSHLQEILLDISQISDSMVHTSQPVTLQTFQGIMQRMGLPENPQLYEPLEHSNTTNDSEKLSNVVIFAEDCRMYFYIPVLKGSLLQRKDAREREEPVNPWAKLLTLNTRTPGQQHLLDQSLISYAHVRKSAEKDGVEH